MALFFTSHCKACQYAVPFAGASLSTNQPLESSPCNAVGSKSSRSKPLQQQHCNDEQTAAKSVSGAFDRRETSSMHRQQVQWQRAGSRLQRAEFERQEGSVSIEM